MNGIESVADLEVLLQHIPANGEFFALIEDWDKGLVVETGLPAADLASRIKALREKCGDGFAFRAFNSTCDLHWNGETGIVATGHTDGDELVTVPLITDSGRNRAAAGLTGFSIRAVPVAAGECGYVRYVELVPAPKEK